MTKSLLLCSFAAALALPATTTAQGPRLSVPPSDVFNPSDPLNGGALPSKTPSLFPGAANSTLPADPSKTAEKKDKGPTEITALEATFDQKAHLAIFIGGVVVKDPEFNVVCEKLTAYLKHDDAPKKGALVNGKPEKLSTPKPAGAGDPAKKSGGGLEKAVAEMNPGGRVEITQDKTEADGTITHSIGHGTKADYNALTGDIILTGTPDVKKGTDWVIATDEKTVITLNRDGRMKAVGPHKTTIVNKADSGLK